MNSTPVADHSDMMSAHYASHGSARGGFNRGSRGVYNPNQGRGGFNRVGFTFRGHGHGQPGQVQAVADPKFRKRGGQKPI